MIYSSADIPRAQVIESESPVQKKNVSDLIDLKYTGISAKTPSAIFHNFVAIDTETTGLSVSKHEIVEVSAIRFRDGKPVENFSALTFPKRGITPEASAINGITESMVANAPLFQSIAASLEDFIGTDNIVGHNLAFDLKFLYKYGVNVLKCKRRYYDTLQIAQKRLKRSKRKWSRDFEQYEIDYDADYDVDDYKLASLCDYYRIKMQDHHRAADDCYAAGLLFIELGAEYKAISATKRAATSLERASHGCGEYSAPLTSSVIVSAPDNNADSSHSPPKKRTFREDAIKNRYLFLIMAVTFAAMSVFLFIDGSVFIGLLTAVVAAMFGVTALLGFIGRHDGAKSQE